MDDNQQNSDRNKFLKDNFRRLPGKDHVIPDKKEREEFNALFRQYYPRLLAYAGLFLDEEFAKDIVQDLMVYLWEKSDTLIIHTSLESYLFRAVYQRCLNIIRHKKIKDTYCHHKLICSESEAEYYDPDRNQVITQIFSKELRKILDDAIESLPPRCREVFIKSYIEGMHTHEIAIALNISERTAETHIYSALKQLREKLKDKVYVLMLLGF